MASAPVTGQLPGGVVRRVTRREATLFVVGLLAAIAVRVALLPTYGPRGDVDAYALWLFRLATDLPFGAAYQLDIPYMPTLVFVLGALARTVPAFAIAPDAGDVVARMALKIPPLLADVAIAIGIALFLRPRLAAGLAAALAVLLVPATWYLSAWWSQWDAIYAATALWVALLAIRNRPIAAAIILGLALMTKPQALVLAVPFGAYAIGKWGLARAIGVGAIAAVVAAATWIPFLPSGGLADYFGNVDALQNGLFPLLSVQAWNPWWLVQQGLAGGAFLSDSVAILGPLTPRHIGLLMTGVAEALVFVAVVRRPTRDRLLLGLAASTLAAFCLMTTMHERYAYAALVFLAPLLDRTAVRLAWGVLAVAITGNMIAGAPPNGEPGSILPLTGPLGIAGSVAMISATVVVVALLLEARDRGRDADPESGSAVPPDQDQGAATNTAPSSSW